MWLPCYCMSLGRILYHSLHCLYSPFPVDTRSLTLVNIVLKEDHARIVASFRSCLTYSFEFYLSIIAHRNQT